MKRALVLIALIACGKKEPLPPAASAPSVVGKWMMSQGDRDYSGTIEFFPDGILVLEAPGRPVWRGTWRFAGRDLEVVMFGQPSVLEVAFQGDTMYLIQHDEATRCRRGAPTPEESIARMVISNERNASTSLRTVCAAEARFRSNDRGTADLASLYSHKLIEVSIALADLACRLNGPISEKAGYWYLALKDGTDGTGPRVSGFAAVPDQHGVTGRRVFIVDEGNTVFWRDFGKDVLDRSTTPPKLNGVFDGRWPSDEERARDWRKLE